MIFRLNSEPAVRWVLSQLTSLRSLVCSALQFWLICYEFFRSLEVRTSFLLSVPEPHSPLSRGEWMHFCICPSPLDFYSVDHALHAVSSNCLRHSLCDHAFRCAYFLSLSNDLLSALFRTVPQLFLRLHLRWIRSHGRPVLDCCFSSWKSRHLVRCRVFCCLKGSEVTLGKSSSAKFVLNLTSTVTALLRTDYRHTSSDANFWFSVWTSIYA
jgi:hypothetical protein